MNSTDCAGLSSANTLAVQLPGSIVCGSVTGWTIGLSPLVLSGGQSSLNPASHVSNGMSMSKNIDVSASQTTSAWIAVVSPETLNSKLEDPQSR
ncbi:hypothetical protein BRD56_09080 [Thermoplasmatales archaeon SW_10_69_26]|nr:MAG: hypothetical protein BRD56_09080 [Thermoplasmatales archaeon SW_10_69_26]